MRVMNLIPTKNTALGRKISENMRRASPKLWVCFKVIIVTICIVVASYAQHNTDSGDSQQCEFEQNIVPELIFSPRPRKKA